MRFHFRHGYPFYRRRRSTAVHPMVEMCNG
jgi:hypothetical protein